MEELFEYYGKNSVEDWRNQDNRKRKWPYGLLERGESFLAKIPHDSKKRSALTNSGIIYRMNNNCMFKKFETLKSEKGYLVTRTY